MTITGTKGEGYGYMYFDHIEIHVRDLPFIESPSVSSISFIENTKIIIYFALGAKHDTSDIILYL